MTTTNIAAHTYWTPGPSQGAGDGSTFDDRQTVPADIGILNILNTDEATPNILYLVREFSNGQLVIANDLSTDDLTNLGGIRTITDAAHNDDQSVAFTWEIGGTTGSTGDSLFLYGSVHLSKCFIGSDSSGTALLAGHIFVSGTVSPFPQTNHVFMDCVMGTFNKLVFVNGSLHFLDTDFIPGAGKSTFGMSGSVSILFENVTTTGKVYILAGGGQTMNFFRYGTITAGVYADNFQSEGTVTTVRKGVLTVEDGGANPLAGIEVYVADGAGFVSAKYVTDANGKPVLDNEIPPFSSVPGDVFVGVSQTAYHRLGSGTRVLIEELTGGETRALSDASDKAVFIFRDPTGTFDTQIITDAMAADLIQTVTMATAGAGIVITSISVPVGRKTNESVEFGLTYSEVPLVSAVTLVRQGGLAFSASAPVQIFGTNGTARFRAGQLPAGIYNVFATAHTAASAGSAQGDDLIIGASTSEREDEFLERILSILHANGPLLDLLPDPGARATVHPDILIDDISNLDRFTQTGGIILAPGSATGSGEEEEWLTTNSVEYSLRAMIIVGIKAAHEGMRDTPDRQKLISLRSVVQDALNADRKLGGFLTKFLVFEKTDTMETKPPGIQNATILIEAVMILGLKIVRRR